MAAKRIRNACLFVLFCLAAVPAARTYSILTHEETIDLLWKDQIQPLLKKRFPHATEQDLKKAHAFAYGGCMLQDMGYYPFGNKYFSDLAHYVRSGDFVVNLIEESSDLNEYAFALGALAHYVADTTGHPVVNQIVAMEFPKLQRKFGNRVTYAQDPKAHIRAEFGLDVVQVSKNRFTSDTYHDFIGFEVAKPVLERAFLKTYGVPVGDVFADLDLSIGTYRRAISGVIPAMTRAALEAHGREFVKETPNFDKKKFLYYLSRNDYEKEWGTKYKKPSIKTRFLALLLKVMPKVGLFKGVVFNTPSQQGEDLYIKSVNQTVEEFARTLKAARQDKLDLPNRDFDTGKPSRGGEYVLTDKTYARLLGDLAKHEFKQVTPDLRANILEFYASPVAPISTRKHMKDWRKTEEQLSRLKALRPENMKPSTGADSGQ
jgi:zinc dependent phospholipase C